MTFFYLLCMIGIILGGAQILKKYQNDEYTCISVLIAGLILFLYIFVRALNLPSPEQFRKEHSTPAPEIQQK